MSTAESAFITGLRTLTDPREIFGYCYAFEMLGCIKAPEGMPLVPTAPKSKVALNGPTMPRRVRLSKLGQMIQGLLCAPGIADTGKTLTEICKAIPASSSTAIKKALETMEKGRFAYCKNSRWFDGVAPAVVARSTASPSKAPAKSSGSTPTLSEAVMAAINTLPPGCIAKDVQGYLLTHYSMGVKLNHLGMALARHARAGRLEERAGKKWYKTPMAVSQAA